MEVWFLKHNYLKKVGLWTKSSPALYYSSCLPLIIIAHFKAFGFQCWNFFVHCKCNFDYCLQIKPNCSSMFWVKQIGICSDLSSL